MPHFAIVAVSILFDGLAYAMFLFITSVGLSVTMGLMGFVNLAHGAFAMAGGFVVVSLTRFYGVGFVPSLVFASVLIGLISVRLERRLYRRLYKSTDLEQVLLTIGLAFMAIATATFGLSLVELEKMTMNAMKSAFIPHQRRVELIRHRLLPTYSMLFAELTAKAFARQLPQNPYLS